MRIKWIILIPFIVIMVMGCTSHIGNILPHLTDTPFPIPKINTMPDPTKTISPHPTSTWYTYEQYVQTQNLEPSSTPDPCRKEIEHVSIPTSNGRTYEEIAEEIFSQWLGEFKSCPPSSVWRIADFKILAVISSSNTIPMYVHVYHSVKPAQYLSSFLRWQWGP